GRRHHHCGAPLGHRAQDQGLPPDQGRQPCRLPEQGGPVPDLGRGPGPVTGGARGGFPRKESARTTLDPMGSRVVFWERRWANPGKEKGTLAVSDKTMEARLGDLPFFIGKATGYLTKILKNGMENPT